MPETLKLTTFATPISPAKLARRIARLVRGANLSYDQWRTLNKRVRKLAGIKAAPRSRPLPRILSDTDFRAFFAAVDAGSPDHAVMLRTMFFTGCRVAELCGIKTEDVDLTGCRVRINAGKGKKDRYTLFPQSFALVLRTYLANHRGQFLFQSRQGGPYTTRRVQQIVAGYAAKAGLKATPHVLRHQLITWLSRQGMTDTQLQPITGHASKQTLQVYQHVALGPDLEARYQQAIQAAL